MSVMQDLEKASPVNETRPDGNSSLASRDEARGDTESVALPSSRWKGVLEKFLGVGGVELRGVQPIPPEDRTETSFINVGTLWFTMNANMLPMVFGMLGPIYGLGLRDSSLVIIFLTLLTTLLPAYLTTLGPKTGMRQMIQARFSFGKYAVCVPVVLNLATLTGFCVIMAVIGGQCLSAVSDGQLSADVGIVIVAVLSLLISFSGFKVLHMYERWAWLPSVICIIIATGCGGDKLSLQAEVEAPATARQVLSFAMIVASYMIPWACLASDFSTYMVPDAPPGRIFLYSYVGLALPTTLLMILGAAVGGAVGNVPDWNERYEQSLVGGALAGMLLPAAGGFGRFVLVLLSFSLLGNLAATSYSITLNFQLLLPWLVRVPRYVFAVVVAAIVIPVSIRAASDFFVNLENFVALIGYWASAFLAVVLAEHVWFRGRDCSTYSHEAWDDAALLPPGVAAIAASVLCFGLVVPTMEQVWWVGPIAETTGDLGFEMAFIVSAVLYVPFRTVEKRLSGR